MQVVCKRKHMQVNNKFLTDNARLVEKFKQVYGRFLHDQEQERHQFATIINDSTIQSLIALHIQLSTMLSHPTETTQAELADTLSQIVNLAEELRSMARTLRPLELDTVGLRAALEQLCAEFADETRIAIIFDGTELPFLPETVTLAFYRLAQEALINACKHAQTTLVRMSLTFDETVITLEISDDGQGFSADGPIENPIDAPGPRLFGLMARFEQINGRLCIHTQPDQGTTLTAQVPWTATQ